MKLIRARVENYRAIESLDLSFLDPLGNIRPITVLAGPNGSGKTSFLFAIANALRGVLGYRTQDVADPTLDDIHSRGTQGGPWLRERPTIRVHLEIQFEEAEQDAILRLFALLKKPQPPTLRDGRIRVNWVYPPMGGPDEPNKPWWYADVEPILPNVKSWLKARGVAIRAWMQKAPGMLPDLLDSIGGLCFFPQDRNLQTRVVGDPTQVDSPKSRETDEDIEGGSGDDESDLGVRTRRQRTVTEILRYLSGYARARATALPDERNWEKRIQDAFAQICGPKHYLGYLYREDDPVGAPVLEDSGRQYPLSQAASGEQVILEYITRLTYPTPMHRSLILIDEPEVHLHPSWVRQLYLALARMPGLNQYILATHSSELKKRAAADNALFELGSLGNGE